MEGCWVVERRAGSNKGDCPSDLLLALLYLAYVQPVRAPGKGSEWEDLGDKALIISAKQKASLPAAVFSLGDQKWLVTFRSKCLLDRGAPGRQLAKSKP